MAATNKQRNNVSSAATKRTKRAAPGRRGKSIVQLRRFKAAKPTKESPLPEPIATFTI